MENKNFELLCSIYSCSEVPTAVLCGRKTFKNSAAEAVISDEFMERIFQSEGKIYEMTGDKICTVNVISKGDIRIAEVIRCENITALLSVPEVKKYAEFVFDKLRHSVNVISIAVDELHSCLSEGVPDSRNAADRLNAVDATLMDIISLIIDPEQLLYLMDENTENSTVYIKDELEKTAADISDACRGIIEIECDFENGLYTRLNRPSFKTIIADIAEKLYSGGIIPDKIRLSSSLDSSGLITVSVSSDCSGGRKSPFCKIDNCCEDIFFEYVCSAFCTKYNGTFEQKDTGNGLCFTLSFPSMPQRAECVRTPSLFNAKPSRFDAANIRMRRLSAQNRYTL